MSLCFTIDSTISFCLSLDSFNKFNSLEEQRERVGRERERVGRERGRKGGREGGREGGRGGKKRNVE